MFPLQAWMMNYCLCNIYSYFVAAFVLDATEVRKWEVVGGRKLRLAFGLKFKLKWSILHSDIWEDQWWRPAKRGMEKQRGCALGWIALSAQIRRPERADMGRATGEAGWGYCYRRKTSLIPQITCHTCGGQHSTPGYTENKQPEVRKSLSSQEVSDWASK